MKESRNKDHGMPMFAPADTSVVEQERTELRTLSEKPRWERLKWYFSKSGPGWMQSAMTLGGGSAMASLFAGAFLEYQILWVQPLAMLLGIIMLSALAYQTLVTQTRPFHAMREFLHPSLAWAWAICTLLATIIWHFPQYALAAGMAEDIIHAVTGWKAGQGTEGTLVLLGLGIVFLAVGILISWNYGNGRKGIKTFENIIKTFIWFIIGCFLAVVIVASFSEDGIQWGRVFSGFLPFSFSGEHFTWNIPTDVRGITIFCAAFSAAVGINATFLFGYSFLAKGWGEEHKGLVRFDLITGMLIPYTIATSLMVIAAGTTIYGTAELDPQSTSLSPIQAARMLEAAGIPSLISRVIFGLGILGMAMNAITIHMLVSGFAVCEIFSIEPKGWKYKLATLIPAPGVLGVVLWNKIGAWIAIPTSAVSLLMLPLAYIGFFLLNNSTRFLGDKKPGGTKARWWNAGMLLAISVTLASVAYFMIRVFPGYFNKF